MLLIMKRTHVWETVEINLEAQNVYQNAYMEVDVWAQLEGPGFSKKVYGFWNGGNCFTIRMTAVCPGKWSYSTFCNTADKGLEGVTGEYEAVDWTAREKKDNPCRRGIITATANGRALAYADGTQVYLLGDTLWAAFTDRFPWYDSGGENPEGSQPGFKDVIRHRVRQGFNLIAALSALPNWKDDGLPAAFTSPEGYVLRDGWKNPQKTPYDGVKEMKNEGGFPFLFPGKVPGWEEYFPDMERPNAGYFQYMDRKMNWLNEQGVTVFIETIRRDLSSSFKRFYRWPESYIRYIQFLFARYQTHNCIFSPIHYDWHNVSIPVSDYNDGANQYIERYGHPPFGTLVSCNPSPSSYQNFGHTNEAKWLTLHQTGNFVREHDGCWYQTEIFGLEPPVPSLAGEPYYPGSRFGCGRDEIVVTGFSEEADIRNRSQLYGNLLSGALAGFIYGAEGMWNANNEPEAVFKIRDALEYPSGYQVRHVLAFIGIMGDGYKNLIPQTEYVSPSKYGDDRGHKGWAYCACTKDKTEFLLYFEVDCPPCELRGQKAGVQYEVTLFDPRKGEWIQQEEPLVITVGELNKCPLPRRPCRLDYGMYLKKI